MHVCIIVYVCAERWTHAALWVCMHVCVHCGGHASLQLCFFCVFWGMCVWVCLAIKMSVNVYGVCVAAGTRYCMCVCVCGRGGRLRACMCACVLCKWEHVCQCVCMGVRCGGHALQRAAHTVSGPGWVLLLQGLPGGQVQMKRKQWFGVLSLVCAPLDRGPAAWPRRDPAQRSHCPGSINLSLSCAG